MQCKKNEVKGLMIELLSIVIYVVLIYALTLVIIR